jgi:hypothetical protein
MEERERLAPTAEFVITGTVSVLAADIFEALVDVDVPRVAVFDTPTPVARHDGPEHNPSSKPKLRLMSMSGGCDAVCGLDTSPPGTDVGKTD